MLVIPDQFAGVGIQGQRAVGVKAIVICTRLRVRQHTGIVGLRDTPERKIKLGVIASGNPHGRAIAVSQRMSIPGVTTLFTGLRDGFESLGFLPGFRIQGDDVIPASHTPTGADHDLVFCDQRPAGELEAFACSERLVHATLPVFASRATT